MLSISSFFYSYSCAADSRTRTGDESLPFFISKVYVVLPCFLLFFSVYFVWQSNSSFEVSKNPIHRVGQYGEDLVD